MKKPSPNPSRARWLGGLLALLAAGPGVVADEHVAVSASAATAYTQRKFAGPKVRDETYVFMEGSYIPGLTADRSIDRMPFRRIAEFLAPELARQHFLPASGLKSADLLIVVHWGTTAPRTSAAELRATTTIELDHSEDRARQSEISAQAAGSSDGVAAWLATGSEVDRQFGYEALERETDALDQRYDEANASKLLGYSRSLQKLGNRLFSSAEEETLRADLSGERYFIIVKAYDLKVPIPAGTKRRAVWTAHLNMRSPGTNFTSAVRLMGNVGAEFFGKSTDRVQTMRPKLREGRVILAPIVVIEDEK